MSTLIISVQHGRIYKSPLRNQKRGMWNNISKRHGHLLLLIITTCKAWKCLRCSYFLNDWLAPLFIHIRKKAKWGEEIVCCCRNVKVTFLALFPGWCHSGECAKGHDFPEGADIFFIAGCLWALIAPSEVRPKPSYAFFCHVWQYQVKPTLKQESKIFAGHCAQPLPAPSYTFWIFSLGASQLFGLCAGCWEGWFSPAVWKH